MKKIKTIIALLSVFTALVANAQIKVHNNGHISIGSLNQDFGVQVQPSGYTYFACRNNSNYGWITMASATNPTSKCWIVRNVNTNVVQPFYVTGGGTVYRVGEVSLSDYRLQENFDEIENPSELLEQMNGFYYNFTDDMSNDKEIQRRVGFSAQEIEKVLPEAVEADENGILYLNYEAITVFLVEAIKEQHKEIQRLNGILEANGLMK